MKKIIRLTESDLTKIVKRVIEEQRTLPFHQTDPLAIAIEKAIMNCHKSNAKRTKRSDYIANQLYNAMDGTTDEDNLYKSLKHLQSMDEFCSVCVSYEQQHKENLWEAFVGDLDYPEEWSTVFRLIPELKV